MKLLGLFALSALGLGAFQQLEQFGTLEVAGVCEMTSSDVRCWDPAGKNNPKIQEMVTSFYVANPDKELHLKFRQKTRLVVMRMLQRTDASASFTGEIYTGKGVRSYSNGQIGYQPGQYVYHMFWLNPGEEEKTVDIVAKFRVTVNESAEIQLKEGAEAKIGGATLKIVSISENPFETGLSYGIRGKSWRVGYRVVGQDKSLNISAMPVGPKDEPIMAVDKNGNPTKIQPSNGGFGGPLQFYLSAAGEVGSPAMICVINPSKVTKVLLTAQTNREMVFPGVALDPLPNP